jgi:hypothetical protein
VHCGHHRTQRFPAINRPGLADNSHRREITPAASSTTEMIPPRPKPPSPGSSRPGRACHRDQAALEHCRRLPAPGAGLLWMNAVRALRAGLAHRTRAREKPCRALAARHASVHKSRTAARRLHTQCRFAGQFDCGLASDWPPKTSPGTLAPLRRGKETPL